LNGKLVKLLEVVRSIKKTVFPVKSEPVDIVDNRLNIFERFACRVSVIHAEIAGSSILGSNSEIEAHRFCVAYMEVSIRLWRKTGSYAALMLVSLEIVFNNLTNKI